LHGNASGAPTWGAVSLTADVSGTLPIANGGTNSTATPTAGGVGYGTSTAYAFTSAGTSGQVLTSAGSSAPTFSNVSDLTIDGTNKVGYLNIPQNSQSAAYTTVLADAGKHIYHPTTDANARTYTIAANSSVAYPIGTVISFVNMTSQAITIAINTDTMYLGFLGTTGSRTLAQYGVANALKLTSTTWIITGTGLT
jgi:hypothetical protein